MQTVHDDVVVRSPERPYGKVVRIVSADSPRNDVSGDWRSSAACRNQDPELFFPIGTTDRARHQLEKAKAVCRACPVQQACLEWVLRSEALGQESGVCAGLDESERRSLKRRAARTSQHSLAVAKR